MQRKLHIIVSLAFVLILFSGCGLGKLRVKIGPDLRFQDETNYRKEGFLIIEGTVKNYGNIEAKDVEIIVKYYDDKDNIIKVDTTTVKALPLKPGQESYYGFQLQDPKGNAVKYKTSLNWK